jgi:hypothetical protein
MTFAGGARIADIRKLVQMLRDYEEEKKGLELSGISELSALGTNPVPHATRTPVRADLWTPAIAVPYSNSKTAAEAGSAVQWAVQWLGTMCGVNRKPWPQPGYAVQR